jgi:hypothetical protein
MSTNKSFRASVLEMEVGEVITIPIELVAYTTIRSYASDLGFAANRKYRTSRNRAERTYSIIREA